MQNAIIYPDVIKAEKYANGDILLTLGDKQTEQERRFFLTAATIKKLADAFSEQTIWLNKLINN